MTRQLIALTLLVLTSTPVALAATLRVPDDHPTIQQAVDASQTGDVIRIRSGTYREVVNIIRRTGLTLRPLGRGAVIVDAGGSGIPLHVKLSDHITVRGLTARNTSNAVGIGVLDSSNVRIERCTVREVFTDGIIASRSSGVLIQRNTIERPGREGVRVYNSTAVHVVDNVVELSSGSGIHVLGSSCTVEANRINDSWSNGIMVGDGSTPVGGNLIRDNRIVNARGEGILLNPLATACSLIGNDIRRSGRDGLDVAPTSDGHFIARNRLTDSAGEGIEIAAGNNRLERNVVRRTDGHGILLEPTAATNLLLGNRVSKAGAFGRGSGFEVAGGGNNLTRNRASRSAGFDLEDSSGAGDNAYFRNRFRTIAP